MQYPSKKDYVKAVQSSASFTTDELRRAEFVLDPVWQIPKPASGTSAVVFKALIDGEAQALRLLTRDDASRADRYNALQDHFTGHDLVSCVAMSSWVDDGIRVNGRTWPVVRMQWVNGRTLNQYVGHLVERGDTRALGRLAEAWRELVLRLQRAEFAHGDLQHGNVLVDDRGALRLVDFDCSWIARFTGQSAPSETGHRNYQPEGRPWGRWMDTFPGLVIYTSLLTLSKNPRPWQALNNEDNLLFRREDFSQPGATPAWQHVSSIGDPQLDQLTAQLKQCCAPGWSASGGLDELLAPRALPWWELTGQAAGPTPARPASQPSTSPLPPPPPVEVPAAAPPPHNPWPAPSGKTSRPGNPPPSGNPQPPWWHDPRVTPGPPVPGPAGPRGPRRGIGGPLAASLVVGFIVAMIAAGGSGEPGAGLIGGLLAALILFLVLRANRR